MAIFVISTIFTAVYLIDFFFWNREWDRRNIETKKIIADLKTEKQKNRAIKYFLALANDNMIRQKNEHDKLRRKLLSAQARLRLKTEAHGRLDPVRDRVKQHWDETDFFVESKVSLLIRRHSRFRTESTKGSVEKSVKLWRGSSDSNLNKYFAKEREVRNHK
ncbi:hypothetical protein FACS1894187_19290 [Synergistales bacterium]|nr:hypothetical protein FACS1894187_19290 [Synergistales bacterium]